MWNENTNIIKTSDALNGRESAEKYLFWVISLLEEILAARKL